jgi:O-antigen/teichoic acid export membrane protein
LKRSIYASYFVQVIAVAVNFIYTLVLVHQLGASGYGDYSLFYNSLAFTILVLGFNLPSVIIFFITNKIIDEGRLLISALIFNFIVALGLCVLLANADTLGFSSQVFPNGDNRWLWIGFFVVLFFLMQTNQVFTAFLNAHKIFIPVAAGALCANLVLIGFWLLYNYGIIKVHTSTFDLVWWVSILVNLLVTGYGFFLILKNIKLQSWTGVIKKTELHFLKGFALIVYLCNSIQFLNYKMDIYFINYYGQKNEVGIYALALSLSQLIWVLPNAVSGVLINYFQVKEINRSVELAIKYSRLCFYGTVVSAFILIIIYYFALPIVYGAEFAKTFRLCAILFAGTIPFSLSIMIANLNSGIGFVRINLYATFFVFLLGLVLDFFIIPFYGLTGAAIVKVVVYIAGFVFQIVFAKKFYNLPWRSMVKRPDLSLLKLTKM